MLDGAIGTATQQGKPIRAKGYIRHDVGVSFQNFVAMTCGSIPNANGLILSATG